MSKHPGKKTEVNGDLSKAKPLRTRLRVNVVVPVKRPRQKTKAPPLVDRVEEASRGSFPCSDPPGYGHA